MSPGEVTARAHGARLRGRGEATASPGQRQEGCGGHGRRAGAASESGHRAVTGIRRHGDGEKGRRNTWPWGATKGSGEVAAEGETGFESSVEQVQGKEEEKGEKEQGGERGRREGTRGTHTSTDRKP